jgi:putative copper export protein
MDILDWILVVIRWGHAIAAVAWVGGGMFYILVLRPSFRRAAAPSEFKYAIGVEFRGVVSTAIAVLLLTGVVISLSRLTSDAVTTPYIGVLVVKISLAVYMFCVVWFVRQRVYPEKTDQNEGRISRIKSLLTSTTGVLIIGLVIFGLSDVLDLLFETNLNG